MKFVDEKSGLQSYVPRLMVRPEARAQNMDIKVNKLSEQPAEFKLPGSTHQV